ncbi:Histone acetyltransferase [Aphelenchoides besseyi]|nr:Histone acetyltransferase [Aphelenchoides besseyi]
MDPSTSETPVSAIPVEDGWEVVDLLQDQLSNLDIPDSPSSVNSDFSIDPASCQLNLMDPIPPTQEKKWHEWMTLDLRSYLISKIFKSIFPLPNQSVLHDPRLKDLILYARKIEKDLFEQANDREEYYYLLAEKIYKIQKELHEKKNQRLQEQSRSQGMEP